MDASLQVRNSGLREMKSLIPGYLCDRAKEWTQARKIPVFFPTSLARSMRLFRPTYCPHLSSGAKSSADGPEHNLAPWQALPTAQSFATKQLSWPLGWLCRGAQHNRQLQAYPAEGHHSRRPFHRHQRGLFSSFVK